MNHYIEDIIQRISPQSGGRIRSNSIEIVILDIEAEETSKIMRIRSQVFFEEEIGGCNCHDDPVTENMSVDANLIYANQQLRVDID